MKGKFAAFYRHSTEENLKKIWEDEKTLFIFDTNILLSIYSYNKQGKDFFFKVLESLGGRVWLPYHVGLEYQRNRIMIIKKATNDFESFKSRINDFQDRLNVDPNKIDAINADFHNLFKQHDSIKENYDDFLNFYKEYLDVSKVKIEEKKSELFKKIEEIEMEPISIDGFDKIRDELDKIFTNDKVGECLFKDELDIEKLNEEAKIRFENKISPGFADEKSKGDSSFFFAGIRYLRKYGDYIIFKELIKKAKDDKKKYENFIFITDDSKQDWIETETINHEKKKIGVLHNLKEEILRESGIKDFMIFDQEAFIKKTNNFIIKNKDDNSFENLINNIKLNIFDSEIVEDNINLAAVDKRFSPNGFKGVHDFIESENCLFYNNESEKNNFDTNRMKVLKDFDELLNGCLSNNFYEDNVLKDLIESYHSVNETITALNSLISSYQLKYLSLGFTADFETKNNIITKRMKCETQLKYYKNDLIKIKDSISERVNYLIK